MNKKIKFPFEPNEKVKKAFSHEVALKHVIEIMTEVMIEAASRVESAFPILIKEHPELKDCEKRLRYNHTIQKIEQVE